MDWDTTSHVDTSSSSDDDSSSESSGEFEVAKQSEDQNAGMLSEIRRAVAGKVGQAP